MLRQHPGIFLPDEKEIHYFNAEVSKFAPAYRIQNPRAQRPLTWYLSLFDNAEPSQLCGEFSTSYLWDSEAPARICEMNQDIKLFASLRDPVQSVFSSYLYAIQLGQIGANTTFEDALERYPQALEQTYYFRHLKRYYDQFPAANILVLFHHDVVADPAAELSRLQGFLEVPRHMPPDLFEKSNTTARPRYPLLARAIRRTRMFAREHRLERVIDASRAIGTAKLFAYLRSQTVSYDERPGIQPATEARLRQLFLQDVESLEELLQVTLPSWKPRPGSSTPEGKSSSYGT